MAVIEPEEFGVSNSILLDDISEKSFIANLKYRFARGRIYTYIGEVVVSVNPYRQLNIYSDDYVFDYRAKEPFERPPHIYAIADSAFHDMRFLHNDSCIVIGGESGSGKTEASKYVMYYIATMSQSVEIVRVKNLLIVSNPLLEAFGNAQTVRNDNSSRFGKYMHITFTVDFKPKGGLVRTYLLEKARVVKLQPGERNFHCFYQLLAGASDRLIGDLQLVRDPSKYRYLSGSNRTATDEHMYSEVLKSMMSLRFTKTDIEDVRCILAAILHLGNVKIEKDGDGESSRVANKKQLNKVATLLGTSMESVARVLTHRMVATKVEVVEAKLNAGRAHYTRDSLAKALYERLFQLIVSRVNRAVSVDFPPGTPTTVISVLDIYGFEVLGVNSFEQFCINYCNERLQQMFIKSVLKKEQEVYRSEGVEWVHISFQDNEPIYTMIESMITAMNDECLRPGEEDDIRILNHFDKKFSETEGYGSHASGNKDIVYNEQFQVTHYAGYVVYDIMNFMDKNKDTQFQDLKRMLYNCELSVLKEMFPEGANPVTDVTKRPITVGTHFKNDVCDLIELLENQTAHFIRCIMPNTKKSPNMWNDELILNQVRYLGLVENTKVRRAGYPYRMKYERFEWRYKMIDPMLWPTHGLTAEQATQKIIATYHLDELVVFGRTQIFFKAPKTIYFLESEREKHLPQIGLNISRWVVGNHIRRKVRKMKALMSIFIWYRRQYLEEWFTEVLENFKDCSTMPDYGKSVEWPHPPPALALGHRLLKKVHINWWARTKITSLSPRDQYEVRLKTVGYKLLYGKKSSLQLTQRWVGDELGREDLNPDAAQFVQVMTGYQDLNGDRQRLYSCHVIKLNRHMHSNPRVFVLCDKFLYWLKTNYQFSNKAPVELGQVTGLSISPGNDQALVVHCVSSVGDFIFYLQNDRPASELLSAIWNIYYRKYRKRLPVNVTTNMKFSRPNVGIREGVLFSDPGQTKTAKSPSFIKVSGGQNRVSIVWPDDSAVSANPRSYL